MTVVIISGSPRPGSQSRRVADFIRHRHTAMFDRVSIELIDLFELALPFWTGEFSAHPFTDQSSKWRSVSDMLERAESLIAVVPEHHGIVPPAFMNLLLHCRYELAHKPGLIVSVSATDGGAYPAAELRAAATKNNRICWIPEQVVVRNVKQALSDTSANPSDRVKARIDYSLTLLDRYRDALKAVRKSRVIDHATFAFGL
ncbi:MULTISPECIES: NAD(P)H-dependent oxidoreductase [unclassified Beijerinckia]|uniref:NADPH-dependent FMN reductase n=1 Tax=unclassified Beijerinckia TaxID=2638183 RepID=UPI000896509A|nr:MULTISPECIES: NAD(P)H-dependent oxidoreductase [unclassified Beijerinckia]MDH7795018.1 NAD(P)H-dependent FMN reductase [Beijerinckia sp. GAS462]SEB84301.1 NADPH-dependent FMN reductase [Beijerinckia sp. 28-YEA-48]